MGRGWGEVTPVGEWQTSVDVGVGGLSEVRVCKGRWRQEALEMLWDALRNWRGLGVDFARFLYDLTVLFFVICYLFDNEGWAEFSWPYMTFGNYHIHILGHIFSV